MWQHFFSGKFFSVLDLETSETYFDLATSQEQNHSKKNICSKFLYILIAYISDDSNKKYFIKKKIGKKN